MTSTNSGQDYGSWSGSYSPMLRFLNESNGEIDPDDEALNICSYPTNIDLAAATAFDGTTPGKDNFRLEVEDGSVDGNSVDVTLKVGDRAAISYTLDKKKDVSHRAIGHGSF